MKRTLIVALFLLLFTLPLVVWGDMLGGSDYGPAASSSMTITMVSVSTTSGSATRMDSVVIPGRRWITFVHSQFDGGQGWCGPSIANAAVLAGFNLSGFGYSQTYNAGPGMNFWCYWQSSAAGIVTVIQNN